MRTEGTRWCFRRRWWGVVGRNRIKKPLVKITGFMKENRIIAVR